MLIVNKIHIILVFLIGLISCSIGDRDESYNACLIVNFQKHCNSEYEFKVDPPLSLKLFRWSCFADVKYNCMHEITQQRINQGLNIVQYYGKWPFWRVFGIQEIFSVIFSIGNGYAHYVHWSKLNRLPNNFYLINYLKAYNLITINTWIWSTVFHCRDVRITERLDYFSALASVQFALHYCFLRVFRVRAFWQQLIVIILSLSFYANHIYNMNQHFDYGYNMKVNIAIGVITNLLWIGWSVYIKYFDQSSKSPKTAHPDPWGPVMVGVQLSLAMSLEILDFPPILGYIDAHSLWHGATILVIYRYYKFMIADAQWYAKSFDTTGDKLI
jgi:hypothetical protein